MASEQYTVQQDAYQWVVNRDGKWFCDVSDRADAETVAAALNHSADVAELAAALKPFADVVKGRDGLEPDWSMSSAGTACLPTIADCRHAATVLSKLEGSGA
jgi:hypothetical protein